MAQRTIRPVAVGKDRYREPLAELLDLNAALRAARWTNFGSRLEVRGDGITKLIVHTSA